MKKPTELSAKDLNDISRHDGSCYKFDLSRISQEKYGCLMRTLRNACLDRFTGVGLNLDLLKQTEYRAMKTAKDGSRGDKMAQKRLQKPAALNSSVIMQNDKVGREICVMFSKVLPKTTTLSFLKLRSLPLTASDIDILAQGIYECETLRVLRFCDVPLGDSGFARLARALRKRSVVDLQLRHCGLTDACGEDMHSLMAYHMFIQSEANWTASLSGKRIDEIVCLKALDLRDNEFTFNFINAIKDPILDVPLDLIDLRGNIGISTTTVAKLQKMLKKLGSNMEVRVGTSAIIKKEKPVSKKKVCGSPASIKSVLVKDPRKSRIEELEEDNAILRDVIEQLKSGRNVVELEPGLRIIGQRANELVEHIRRLDDMLASHTSGPSTFLNMSSNSFGSSDSLRRRHRV